MQTLSAMKGTTMRVAVTGICGDVGGFVAREFRAAGHEVVGVDLREPATLELAAFHQADIEDLPALTAAFAGCDAVVHLAALREPGLAADDVVFRLNTMGTFNALEAAVAGGARRLVLASSEAVLGFSFSTQTITPAYFPIDEGHPTLPQDPYGLSKLVGEELCAAYSRRGAISTICLRTSYVFALEWAEDAMDALTDPVRGQRGLWSYVHARDAAVAYRLACEVEGVQHASLFIVGPDARTSQPTDEVLARFYPDTPQRTRLSGTDPIISGAEAARVLGFTPRHSWRDEIAAASTERGGIVSASEGGTRVALVSGAARGIGAAVAKRLGEAGYQVLGADVLESETETAYPLAALRRGRRERRRRAGASARSPSTAASTSSSTWPASCSSSRSRRRRGRTTAARSTSTSAAPSCSASTASRP